MGVKKMGLVFAFLGFLFFDGLLLRTAAEDHHYSFILRESLVNFTRLCGQTKSMFTVEIEGLPVWPGPTIHVRKGDTAYINVHNNGDYGVTIHWHGVKQPRNPWYDGPEYVTQMPIEPQTNLTYEVIFSDEEGTLWWHAHSGWSRATIHGAIVIKPPEGAPYPYDTQPDGEHVLVLGEWYNGDVMENIEEALRTGGDPKMSDGYAINGLLGPSDACPDDPSYPLLVEHGKTYLLRIVNAVMNEEMFFGIADHTITVVGQDGAYITPITVDYIMITPGQTMDVLLTANQAPSYYYIVATPFMDHSLPAPFDKNNTSAILMYTGATPPTTIPSPSLPDSSNRDAASNFTSQIKSLNPVDVPTDDIKRILIAVSVNRLPCTDPDCKDSRQSASLNNISFLTPTTDILHSYYCGLPFDKDFPAMPPVPFDYTGDEAANYELPSVGTKALIIDYGTNVEIVFQGTNVGNAENHPMHLHGYSFFLVGTGDGNWDRDDITNYNTTYAPAVNTIGVPKNGWAAIRFKADNPGVWFMHCHLERHSSWGMSGVIIVQNGDSPDERILLPPPNFPACPPK
ncbi:laccase-14-like [Corylus avellana]|uniref:laccase-14-like n=1 Tax=Corylus avellana TaxID=13451 RepID=UPI00286B2254|nr:laccase-14-like [Corylus avellana]